MYSQSPCLTGCSYLNSHKWYAIHRPRNDVQMYSEGHWGIGMLLYSPVVFLLLLLKPALLPLLVLGLAPIAFGAVIPDIDMKLKNYLPIRHRGITHTVWFALLMGPVVAGVFFGLGWYAEKVLTGRLAITMFDVYVASAFLGVLGIYGTLTHFVGDVITPTGLKPLEPVSDKRYRHVMTVFGQKSKAANGYWNRALYIIGTGAIISAFVIGAPRARGLIMHAFNYLL